MHVNAIMKGLQQGHIAADVGHDAQLNLAVIGAGNNATHWCHKGLTHAPALYGADRDVLQVGVVATEPPGHRHGLRVVRVHSASARVGQCGKLVGVGAFELGQPAVLQ